MPCEQCHGSGAEAGTDVTVCQRCGGTGQQRTVRQSLLGQIVTASTCSVCDGSGHELRSPCGQCRGQGVVAKESVITVDIAPGVEDGMRERLPGRGHAGQYGGPSGDLWVEPGTQPGTVKRFRKRGIPSGEGWGRRGDLLVELKVDIPTDFSEEERRLLRQIAELRGEPNEAPANRLFARLRGSAR